MALTPLVQSLTDRWGGCANMRWVWMAMSVVIIGISFVAIKAGDRMRAKQATAAE